ncbi:MAG: heme o synthase [Crocinitomicaceae bacterium]|nr:heme o synthase [Crocinitomicaceae bacterium]
MDTVVKKMTMRLKMKSYASFIKFRLSALVIISALSGYLFAGGKDGLEIFYLLLGGLLVTGASNGSNQIWERDFDKLMKRTHKRPLPTNEMSLTEAYSVVIISLLVGTALLYQLNLYAALLGLLAYISYVFIYTPMKRVTPWAVFVGAFPGAIPPMLGVVAFSGKFEMVAGILFFVQFVWQFPHFWAIAWVSYEDYKAGGYTLLPSKEGKGKASAFQIAVYSLILIPFTLLPWVMGMTGTATLIIGTITALLFFLYAYKLYITCDDKDARKLMFASFIFLPVVQFLYVFDKIPTSHWFLF